MQDYVKCICQIAEQFNIRFDSIFNNLLLDIPSRLSKLSLNAKLAKIVCEFGIENDNSLKEEEKQFLKNTIWRANLIQSIVAQQLLKVNDQVVSSTTSEYIDEVTEYETVESLANHRGITKETIALLIAEIINSDSKNKCWFISDYHYILKNEHGDYELNYYCKSRDARIIGPSFGTPETLMKFANEDLLEWIVKLNGFATKNIVNFKKYFSIRDVQGYSYLCIHARQCESDIEKKCAPWLSA